MFSILRPSASGGLLSNLFNCSWGFRQLKTVVYYINFFFFSFFFTNVENYHIYSKERLLWISAPSFDVKYLMNASLEWMPPFSLKILLVLKGGAHLGIS